MDFAVHDLRRLRYTYPMMRVVNWALPGLAAVLIFLVIRRWVVDQSLDIASLVIAIAAIALMILTYIQDKSP